MSEAVTIPTPPSTAEPEPVVIRRNGVLLGVLGFGAGAICLAYAVRAVSGGSSNNWLMAVVLAVIAVPYLWMLAGAGMPLLVADETGVRIRFGGQWRGLRWGDMAKVDVRPRAGFLRDGRVVIEAGDEQAIDAGLTGVGRIAAQVNTRFYGKPLVVSYGFTTAASTTDMAAALTELAAGRVAVKEVEETPVLIDPSGGDSWAASNWTDPDSEAEDPGPPADPDEIDPESRDPVETAAPVTRTVQPARSTLPALRAEITKQSESGATASVGALALSPSDNGCAPNLPEEPELRRSGANGVSLDIDSAVPAVSTVEPVDDEPTEDLPAADGESAPDNDPDAPVSIGAMVAQGRAALGLSVDELAARTRIRPHVIESVERDDFLPCGGDFYARGHLRTFARALGIDEAKLIDTYDDEYAAEPISPRVVFQAELATGPTPSLSGGTTTSGGPKWGTLVAVVLLVLMAWGVIRLLVGGDHSVNIDPPVVNGSGGITSPGAAGSQVPHASVRLRAAYGDSRVTARSAGQVLFKGRLNAGTTKVIRARHAIHVTLSDGGAVLVTTNGKFRRTLADPGESVTTTIRPKQGSGKSGNSTG